MAAENKAQEMVDQMVAEANKEAAEAKKRAEAASVSTYSSEPDVLPFWGKVLITAAAVGATVVVILKTMKRA